MKPVKEIFQSPYLCFTVINEAKNTTVIIA